MKRMLALISILSIVSIFSVGCGSDNKQGEEPAGDNQATEEAVQEDKTSEGTKVAMSTKTYEIFEGLSIGQSYEELSEKVKGLGMVEKEPLKEGALGTQRGKYALDADSQYTYLDVEVLDGAVIAIGYTVQLDLEDTGFKAERALYDDLTGKVESKQITTLGQIEKEIGEGYLIKKEYKIFKDTSSGDKKTYRWADSGSYYIEVSVDESGNIIGSPMGSIRKE